MNDSAGKTFSKMLQNRCANCKAMSHRSYFDILCLLILNKVEIKRNKETKKGERRNNMERREKNKI